MGCISLRPNGVLYGCCSQRLIYIYTYIYMLTFQNVVDWVAVLPGRGEDGKDILSDFELLIWGFARNEDF